MQIECEGIDCLQHCDVLFTYRLIENKRLVPKVAIATFGGASGVCGLCTTLGGVAMTEIKNELSLIHI